MPAPEDAPPLFFCAAALALGIAACLHWGRAPFGRGLTIVRRDQQPTEFWFAVCTLGAVFIFVAFMGVLAIAPWPASAETWAAPHLRHGWSSSASPP